MTISYSMGRRTFRRWGLAVFLAASPFSAQAQGLSSSDTTALKRALEVDPFALAPYRLLTINLKALDRKHLVEAYARSGKFSDRVVAARLELDSGQAAAARVQLHEAAAQLPADPRTLDAFGQLALSAGAHVEAVAAARKSLERGRTPQRLVTAAIAELRQGRRKEGLELLAESRTKDPSGGVTEAALDTLLGQRMVAEAAELLRAQLEPRGRAATTGSAAQWRRLADLERQLGRHTAASDALLNALDAEGSSTGRRAIAQSILRMHRERKSLPELARSLKDARTTPRLTLRGDLELEQKHASAAEASYAEAAKLDPSDPDPPMRLAAIAKTPAERAARFATVVAAHPAELRYALELAELRFAAKDEAGGLRALNEAASRLASAPSAQEQLARRLSEHGDPNGALMCRKRAAELDPRNVDYAIALGDAYRAAGKRNEALAAYADSIARAGGTSAAYDRVIGVLERAGFEEEADARYRQARERWPADLALARRHAAALERRKLSKAALDVWKYVLAKSIKQFEQEQASFHIKRLENATFGMEDR